MIGRTVADEFLQDKLLYYYFIMQIAGAVLGLAQVFLGATDGVINGYALLIALFLPPIEIFFLHRMRKQHEAQKIRNWGSYYLVFFAVMCMVTLLTLMGLGVMIFAPEEGMELPGVTDYIAAVWMIISCLYYLFMGISARQLATLKEYKSVHRSMMMMAAVVTMLVNVDTLVQLVQTALELSAFTLVDSVAIFSSLLAVASRTLMALLLYKAHRSWAMQASAL